MKPTLYTLLAAAAACGLATAAETAYTKPVGYTTQTLAANSFNLVGFNVLSPSVAAGKVTAVSGAEVTDSTASFDTALPAGKTCVLEITSGTAAGTVQEFTNWTASTITLPAAIGGLAPNDTYVVRVVPTLQETFPAGFLAGSGFASTADKVWVPQGSGAYLKYWYKSTTPNVGWHTTSTGSNDTGLVTSDVPLVYIDGILVEKKATPKDFVLTGEVKTTGSNVLLTTGFNLISINPPTGLTLFTSGLQGDIAGSGFPSSADIVWVPQGGGAYIKYWYKTTTPNIGWHTTVTGSTDTGLVGADVPLPASIFLQRKGASKVVTLDVPSGYSSL